MSLRVRWTLSLLALGFVLPAPPAHSTQPELFAYADEPGHFRVKIPAAWQRIPSNEVEAFRKHESIHAGRELSYEACFQRNRAAAFGVLPYFCTGHQEVGGASLDDLAKAAGSRKVRNDSLGMIKASGFYRSIDFGVPVVDRPLKALIFKMKGTLVDNRETILFGFVFPGRLRMIQLVFALDSAQAESSMPDVDAIVGSFKFDAGFGYVEP